MAQLEHSGYWWLPDDPEHKLPGNFTFDPIDGGTLSLLGDFGSRSKAFNLTDPDNDIILGVSSTSKSVTLYRCYSLGTRRSMSGANQSVVTTYRALVIFEGYHFVDKQSMTFSRMQVGYTGLSEWLWRTGFTLNHGRDGNGDATVQVLYKYPDRIPLDLGDLKVSLVTGFEWTQSIKGTVTMKETPLVEIEPSGSMSFDCYDAPLTLVRSFLAFAMGSPVYPTEISAFSAHSVMQLPNGKDSMVRINVLRAQRQLSANARDGDINHFLLPASGMRDKLAQYFRTWSDKSNELEPIRDLYMEVMYAESTTVQTKFLHLINAVEAYHRRFCPGQHLADSEYERVYAGMKDFISARLSGSIAESLKQKLKYGNEYSLRQRLKELCKRHPVLQRLDKPNTFINDVVNTRNYLTHYDQGLASSAKDGVDLYKINTLLTSVLDVCLLAEVGFSPHDIEELVATRQRFKVLRETR